MSAGEEEEPGLPQEMAWWGDDGDGLLEQDVDGELLGSLVLEEDDEEDVFAVEYAVDSGHSTDSRVADSAGADGRDGIGVMLHEEEEEDIVAKLQASIERDLPKVKISAEFQRMLDAVEEDAKQGITVMGEGLKKKSVNVDNENVVDGEAEPCASSKHEVGASSKQDYVPDIDLEVLVPRSKFKDSYDDIGALLEDLSASSGCKEENDNDGGATLEERKQRTFLQLQPICSRLVKMRSDTQIMSELFTSLGKVFRECDALGLQECFGYAMFPLSICLDSIVLRQGSKQGSHITIPAMQNDDLAILVLQILLELMKRCHPDNEEHMITLVQRLCGILAVPEQMLSEEGRRISSETLHQIFTVSGREICGWVDKEEYASIVGVLISTLLNHPYNDPSKPNQIHNQVQLASLEALKAYIDRVKDPESIAFFVPGLATGLVKKILQGLSSNALSDKVFSKHSSSTSVAIDILRILISKVLSDSVVEKIDAKGIEKTKKIDDKTLKGSEASSSTKEYARDMLLKLASSQDNVQEENVSETMLKESFESLSSDKPSLRIEVSANWIKQSAERLDELLNIALKKLRHHDSPSVRLALVRFSCALVDNCSFAFKSNQEYLDNILILAQDSWRSVRLEASNWVKRHASSQENAARMKDDLSKSLHSLDMSIFRDSGKCYDEITRISSFIEYLPSRHVVDILLPAADCIDAFLSVMLRCFALDEGTACMACKFTFVGSTMKTRKYLELGEAASHRMSRETWSGVPRVPLGLKYINTEELFKRFARFLWLTAKAAFQVDSCEENCGTNFASLLDSCVRHVQTVLTVADRSKVVRSERKRIASVSFPITVLDDVTLAWQLEIAQTIHILSEFIYGVSSIWKSNQEEPFAVEAETAFSDAQKDRLESMCRSVIFQVSHLMFNERIWSLPCHEINTFQIKGDSKLLPQRNAGNEFVLNGIMLQSMLEFISVSAASLGHSFSQDARLMHEILLPIFDKMPSENKYVSVAARNCMDSLCIFCGYGSLQELVQRNIDYIIDGMCLRLRQPSIYPNAPELFSGMLQESGVAAALVPLLAEPAAHALRGISIMQRHLNPQHVLSFVSCLKEIGKGSFAVAERANEIMQGHANKVAARLQNSLRHTQPPLEDTGPDESSTEGDIRAIERYFKEKMYENESIIPEKVPINLDDWNSIVKAKMEAISCALLSKQASDTANPLMVSDSLHVAIRSIQAVVENLRALKTAHDCIETFTKKLEESVKCNDEFWPPRNTQSPTFLPSVHLMWLPLMSALKDWRISLIESSVNALKDVVYLAPEFLARRFRNEAWPQLQRLLVEGPAKRNIIAPGSDDTTSPVHIIRIRRAILQSLSALAEASHENKGVSTALVPLSYNILQASYRIVLEEKSMDSKVSQAAISCFKSCAALDPDAAWSSVMASEQKESLCCYADSTTIQSNSSFSDLDLNKIQLFWEGIKTSESIFHLSSCSKANVHGNTTVQSVLLRHIDSLPIPWHSQCQQQDEFS